VHAWLLWSAVGVGKRGKRESAGKRRKRGKSARSEAKNRGKTAFERAGLSRLGAPQSILPGSWVAAPPG